MRKTLLALFAAIPLFAGCAVGRPDISREEWKIRSYEGIPKHDILDAAREVIRLADPDDTKFESKPDGFNAVRQQLSYYVVASGHDIFAFDFVVRETGGKMETRLEIQERVERSDLLSLGLPIANVGKPQNSYIYDLFYSRMEYLLGLSDRWHTCQDAVGTLPGSDAEEIGIGAFCGRFASDHTPPPFAQRKGDGHRSAFE